MVTVVAMAVTVVMVVAMVTMVLVATVVVWRRETAMAATVAGVNHRDADGKDERDARGEMAQRCKRVVCTRDVPHKLIVERARGAPALLGPGVPSGSSSSSIRPQGWSVMTLSGVGREPRFTVTTPAVKHNRERKNGLTFTFSRSLPHHSTVSESGSASTPEVPALWIKS